MVADRWQDYDMEPRLLGLVINAKLVNAVKGYAVTCLTLVAGKVYSSMK